MPWFLGNTALCSAWEIFRMSCVRDDTPSFWMMCRRWYSTVAGLMKSLAATSRLVSPSTTSRATWFSCAVRHRLAEYARCPPMSWGQEMPPG